MENRRDGRVDSSGLAQFDVAYSWAMDVVADRQSTVIKHMINVAPTQRSPTRPGHRCCRASRRARPPTRPSVRRPDQGIEASRHERIPAPRSGQETVGCCSCSTPVDKRSCWSGGSKSGNWVKWYTTAIPRAEKLYTDYITELEADSLLDEE